MLLAWLQSILQGLTVLTISPVAPSAGNADWKLLQDWQAEGQKLVLKAESETVVQFCETHPADELVTPTLVQGGHQIFLDNVLVHSSVDRDFNVAGDLYNVGRVPCKLLISGKVVRWEAYTQTRSLAKLRHFPEFEERSIRPFLRQAANVFVAGTLLGLGIVCLLMFYGKVDKRILQALIASCISFGFMFTLCSPRAFLIELPQFTLQRMLDASLWVGFIALARWFNLIGYASHKITMISYAACVLGLLANVVGANLDQTQVGNSIPLAMSYIFLFSTLKNKRLTGQNKRFARRNNIFRLLSVSSFVLSSLNDLLLVQLNTNSEPLLPFGILGSVTLLALAVNDKVMETYEERDFLRQNLEKEVERKTEALQKKSAELASTLQTLKATQADLVQSAKLASLGTLSAGIAHEINNALNYVYGSVDPLANIIKKDQLGEIERGKANRLLKLMKEGLELTFGIIVNLKRQTSGSPDQLETISIKEMVEGVILLLKNKLAEIEVQVNVVPEVKVEASQVGLSQIFMNILGNAAEAIHEGVAKKKTTEKRIVVSAQQTPEEIIVHVRDSGPGVPAEVKDRIFDPFFTTKEVGKGTGLGLHIVMSEMKKYGGKVEVSSPAEGGADFSLVFPDRKTPARTANRGAA